MFVFSLAEHLCLPVGEMLRRMDSRELSEWMAYFIYKRKEVQQETQSQQAEMNKLNAKAELKKEIRRR